MSMEHLVLKEQLRENKILRGRNCMSPQCMIFAYFKRLQWIVYQKTCVKCVFYFFKKSMSKLACRHLNYFTRYLILPTTKILHNSVQQGFRQMGKIHIVITLISHAFIILHWPFHTDYNTRILVHRLVIPILFSNMHFLKNVWFIVSN